MAEFFIYILKWAVTLTLLYSFYGLCLRRETFHTLNRMVLLGILVASMVLPTFHVTTTQPTLLNQSMESVESVMLSISEEQEAREMSPVTENLSPFSWIRLTFIIYLWGLLVCWLHYFYNLLRFSFLVLRAQHISAPEVPTWVHVSVSSSVKNSCSWLRWIVLAPADAQDAKATILTHELAHIQRGHSWDKLLCECTCRMLWFLPFTWMLRQDLADVHEFEADRAVLNTGVNLKEYNELIIRKAVRTRLQPVVNAFNESKTKKRMMMMFKRKSTKLATLKVLYLLPLTAFAITAFAKPQLAEEIEDAITQAPLDIFPLKDEEPIESDINNENDSVQMMNVAPTEIGQEVTNVLLVVDRIPVNLDTNGDIAPLYIDGHGGEKEFATLSSIQNWDRDKYAQIANLDTANIESITILKDYASKVIWGKLGRNGVIEVQTKDGLEFYQTLRAGDIITGRVWAEEDSNDYVPIENAQVCEVTDLGQVIGKLVTTNTRGDFRLQITNPANRIRITKKGYNDFISSIRKRSSYYHLYPKNYFEVKAGDIVTGEVLNYKKPIPDVYVSEIDGVGNPVNCTKTDASGKFSLKISDPKHRLEGRHDRYTTQSVTIHRGNNKIRMEPIFPDWFEKITGLEMNSFGFITLDGKPVTKITIEGKEYDLFPPAPDSINETNISLEEFESLRSSQPE